MALRYAIANGNWSNPATWDGGTLPTSVDDVFANNFTVTINGTFTVLTIRTTSNASPAITAGGLFTFANGGDLTCTASNGIICREVNSTSNVFFDLPLGQSATLRANVNFVQFSIGNSRAILVQNTGTFNMFGNYEIGSSGNSFNRATILVGGAPTINIVGNITSSISIAFNLQSTIWISGGTPTINITGNVSGGTSNSFGAGIGNAIYSQVASTINITGNVTTNLAPSILLAGGGTLNVTGNTTAATGYPAIYSITVAPTISVTGTVTASATSSAIIMTNGNSQVYLNGNMVNVNGRMAIFAPIVWLDRTGTTSTAFFTSGGGNRTLYSANTVPNTPAASNVRLGTIYGAGNSLAGTLAMPVAANTRNGVVYDNGTTGTALFTTDTLLSELNSSSDPVAVRIKNAATPQILGELMEAYKR